MQEKGLSMINAALSILHHSLDAQSYDMFVVDIAHDVRPKQFLGTVYMLLNTMVVSFGGKNVIP